MGINMISYFLTESQLKTIKMLEPLLYYSGPEHHWDSIESFDPSLYDVPYVLYWVKHWGVGPQSQKLYAMLHSSVLKSTMYGWVVTYKDDLIDRDASLLRSNTNLPTHLLLFAI